MNLNPKQLITYIALVLGGLAGPTLAQPKAQYNHFSKGCQIVTGREHVYFRVSGLPRLGGSLLINSDAHTGKNKWVSLVTGFSNSRYGSLPLPYSRFPSIKDVRWCGALLVSMDVLQPATGALRFHIPGDKTLLGLRFFQQILHITFVPNHGFRVDFSRGGAGTVGL